MKTHNTTTHTMNTQHRLITPEGNPAGIGDTLAEAIEDAADAYSTTTETIEAALNLREGPDCLIHEVKHMDHEGKWAMFEVGMSLTHVTDEGVTCRGRITATDGDSLHIKFTDGEEGWEKTTSCFLD